MDSMTLILALFFLQALPPAANVSHEAPIDPEHTLQLIGGRKQNEAAGMGEYGRNVVFVDSSERLRLVISERSGPAWELRLEGTGLDIGVSYVRVSRLDKDSVVLQRIDADGLPQSSLKLFFDLNARRLLKTIAFEPVKVVRLQVNEGRVCASVKAAEVAFVSCGGETSQSVIAQLGPAGNLPEVREHPSSQMYPSPLAQPVPQSTYDQFAKARPGRVRDGYSRRSTQIREVVGAFQVVGDRTWFGKAFYDGEGTTGVGGAGYFDAGTAQFTMLPIDELVPWSTSALLVENDDLWLGIVTYPEGPTRSGGLLRYDFATRLTSRYEVTDMAMSLLRQNESLFIGTSNGLYVLRDGRMTRFRYEPNLEGKFEPVLDPMR
jgi:hypothetical protein